MNLRDYDDQDGKKVWLTQPEVAQLLEATDSTKQRIALALGARCGLRSHEIVDVAPQDVVDSDAGTMLRVWAGKGDKYRETPVPPSLATTIRTVADVRDAPADAPLVDKSKRTIRRWVTTTAATLQEETDDVGWQYLGAHDLRRTWATALSDADVDPLLVIDWGGWNDLETFLEHYKGAFSPDAHRRERGKVDWL